MDIKTKFNYGDTVFFMRDNMVKRATIKQIDTRVCQAKCLDVKYALNVKDSNGRELWNIDEHELHATKEDLLKSL